MVDFTPEWTDVAKVVGAIASGGALLALFNYLTESRKLRIADKNDLLERMNVILKQCEDDRDALKVKINDNGLKIASLEEQVTLVRRTSLDLCMPCWRTTLDHRYLSVNDIAVQIIFAPLGLDREYVLGATDEELWDPHVCAQLNQLDQRALLSPLKNAYIHSLQFHKRVPRVDLHKYVSNIDDPKHAIGFINYAIPLEPLEHAKELFHELHDEDDNDDEGD